MTVNGSDIQVMYDGVDITSSVMFADAAFEMQMNAIPGMGRFRVLDPDRNKTFVTGKEIRVKVDNIWMWGGYLRRKTYGYAFDADDTRVPSTYRKRIWTLEAADYNILWDALVLRRTDKYTGHIPNEAGYPHDTMDGWAIWKMLQTFSDFPSGFGINSDRGDAAWIDNVREVHSGSKPFVYKQQGTKLRDQMDEFGAMAGAAYYISADKRVHYHAYESVIKRWGFSDAPNRVPITVSPDEFQSSTWGFREVTGEEDGTEMINDALIWGGSPLGSDGDVLFARYQEEVDDVTSTSRTYIQHGSVVADSSIDKHGRWQLGETHFEGGGFGNLNGVKARADVLLHGPTGTSALDGTTKGYSKPTWTFNFTWLAWDIPMLSGARDHILAGDLVRIELATFNIARFLPCRTVRIHFAALDREGEAFVMLSGDFSYAYTDPTTLWRALRRANQSTSGLSPVPKVTTVDNDDTQAEFGGFGLMTPIPPTDGITTAFQLPNDMGYIAGSLEVFINGLIQRHGLDYFEVSGTEGTFTMSQPPVASDNLQARLRTLAT